MTYLDARPTTVPALARHREGNAMLLMHEALARSRQREAEQAAREYALARRLVAESRWSRLARFAARRAARAGASASELSLAPATGAAV